MKTVKHFWLFTVFAACAFGQTQIDFQSQIKNKFSYPVTQNTAGTNGGYMIFAPVTYNPYGSQATCFDLWGNPVQQPLPGNAQAAFGPHDLVLWNSLSPSLQFAANTGTGLVQKVVATSPSTTNTGPCGQPLPVELDYGLNLNGYFFARGGLATDLPYYNSIQSLQGGMVANSYTAGVLYPAGTTVCTAMTGATCSATRVLSVPEYLGGHVDVGHSNGPPQGNTIQASANPYSFGEGAVAGQMYYDDGQHCLEVYSGTTWGCASGGGGGTAAGPNLALQYNNNGAFGGAAALTYNAGTNLLIMTGTAGQGVIAPVFNATAGGGNLEFQGSNFSVHGDGHIGTNGQIEMGGMATPPAASAAANVSYYYNGPNQEFYFSYAGSGYTGMRAPLFNGVVTGLSGANKTFQNSDGSFSIDYLGNIAAQGATVTNALASGWVDFTERAAPAALAGHDILYGDSGTHQLLVSLNGGGFVSVTGGGSGSPGGPTTSVQFNSAGAFSGSPNFEWNNASQQMIVAGVPGTAGIATSSGFIQSAQGFVAGNNAYNSFHTSGTGGMAARNFTATGYVQTGNSNGPPAAGQFDTLVAGTIYWDTGSVCEELYNGSTWSCLGGASYTGGTGVTISGGIISIGQAVGTSSNVTFNAVTAASLTTGGGAWGLNNAGVLTVASCAGCAGAASGVNTSVQYNSSGVFGGSSNFTFNPGTFVLTATGGMVAAVFNCTAAGGSPCIQQQSGTFSINGAGAIAAQSASLAAALTVGGAATFNGGINIPVNVPSQVYIGNTGNFYDRALPGGSAAVSCAGVADGWMAVSSDAFVVVCLGGSRFRAGLANY